MDVLRRYTWPGNIRELENVIERAVIMVEDSDEVHVEDLPLDLVHASTPMVAAVQTAPGEELREAERTLLLRTLRECNWNRSLAAKRLGIGRRTLYDKLDRLGISLHPTVWLPCAPAHPRRRAAQMCGQPHSRASRTTRPDFSQSSKMLARNDIAGECGLVHNWQADCPSMNLAFGPAMNFARWTLQRMES